MRGPPKTRDLDRPALVSLENLIPADHCYRRLDRGFVRAWVADNYTARGRPGIDPQVFCKLQSIMFIGACARSAGAWRRCASTSPTASIAGSTSTRPSPTAPAHPRAPQPPQAVGGRRGGHAHHRRRYPRPRVPRLPRHRPLLHGTRRPSRPA